MSTVALLILAIVTLLGALALARGLKRAPVGYEDGLGFHVGEPARTMPMILAVTTSIDSYDHGAEATILQGVPVGAVLSPEPDSSCSD
jgi:hypothetical protein